jgi:uncharacterized membrane protein YkvI
LTGLRRIWRAYIVPAAVFQSLMIGGGYATGREIVEYFSRHGLRGGLCGLALVAVCFSVLLSISYEFARIYQAYDYRSFFRELLGKAWVAFEVLYLAMFALVVAVVCAASGSLVEDYLHLPSYLGMVLLLIVVPFAFYGREWVTGLLAFKALVLCVVVLSYFLIVGWRFEDRIAAEFARSQIDSGWMLDALRFTLYASVIIPVSLFAARAIETRRQAVISGVASAFGGMIPGALMHVSFAAGYPEVLSVQVPAYWMIVSLGIPALTIAYVTVLFGSLLDVGLGFIQSVNERLDEWSLERRGRGVGRRMHAAIALMCVVVSGVLSLVGVVPLIAKGYGTMAWGFLFLFVGPLLTLGVWKISSQRAAGTRPLMSRARVEPAARGVDSR